MSNAVLTGTLKYKTAGEANVTQTLAETAPYAGLSAGSFDVASGTLTAEDISPPLGSVETPTAVFLQNNTDKEVQVTLGVFNLPPGGYLIVGMPTAAADNPLDSIAVETTDTHAEDGTLDYLIAGDPVA